jgi:hypothetical protein
MFFRDVGRMTSRISLLTVFMLLFGPVWAAPLVQPARPVAENAAPISFYVVKGPPGACGPGCDRWIAAEGKIDGAAAARFRKFMKQIGDVSLPIYLHSPGGNLEQALAIGNMLREKKFAARVGRTMVEECGFEAQDSDVCVKLKQSGRELHGEVWLRNAQCNSACPYLILGAVTREIAPETSLAVHSPHVILNFTGGVPTREMRTAALQQAMSRADRLVADYLKRMGADAGLLAVARSVRFEDMHVLTREEIVRFGIDRREQVETPWVFENANRSLIHKTVMRRDGSEQAFRSVQLRLICSDPGRFQLDYQRPIPLAGFVSVALVNEPGKLSFYFPPRRAAGQEAWALHVSRPQLEKLAASGRLELSEGTLANGQWQFQPVQFGAEGFAQPFERLAATCPSRTPAVAPLAVRNVVASPAK